GFTPRFATQLDAISDGPQGHLSRCTVVGARASGNPQIPWQSTWKSLTGGGQESVAIVDHEPGRLRSRRAPSRGSSPVTHPERARSLAANQIPFSWPTRYIRGREPLQKALRKSERTIAEACARKNAFQLGPDLSGAGPTWFWRSNLRIAVA
ncbi:MAG: hypothetical protein ACREP9_12340, partial [Candidatus Dormibacteraceae bacterium]